MRRVVVELVGHTQNWRFAGFRCICRYFRQLWNDLVLSAAEMEAALIPHAIRLIRLLSRSAGLHAVVALASDRKIGEAESSCIAEMTNAIWPKSQLDDS